MSQQVPCSSGSFNFSISSSMMLWALDVLVYLDIRSFQQQGFMHNQQPELGKVMDLY